MSGTKISLSLMIGVALILCNVTGSQGIKELYKDHIILRDYYDLFYSDLVIRGVIEHFVTKRVPWEDVDPTLPDLLKGLKILEAFATIRVMEIVKGNYKDDQITILIPWSHAGQKRNYSVGDSIIISLVYKKKVLNGIYRFWGDDGRFMYQDGKWVNQSTLRSFTLEKIKSMLAPTKLENVIKSADLIVVGKITGIKHSFYIGPGGKDVLAYITMKVEEVKKGSLEGTQVPFRMLGNGSNWPAWKQKPPIVKKGERWYVFLKKDADGYYPHAGVNGAFKIEGDKLIYDGRTEYKFKKSEIDKITSGEANYEFQEE